MIESLTLQPGSGSWDGALGATGRTKDCGRALPVASGPHASSPLRLDDAFAGILDIARRIPRVDHQRAVLHRRLDVEAASLVLATTFAQTKARARRPFHLIRRRPWGMRNLGVEKFPIRPYMIAGREVELRAAPMVSTNPPITVSPAPGR